MKKATCKVCGQSWNYTPHRENTTASDHVRESHPGINPGIPTADLFVVADIS